MKCECCHLNEACIEVKQVTEDACREVHLCAECAAQKGLNTAGDLAGLLIDGGLFAVTPGFAEAGQPESVPSGGCPGCHMRASDFRKTGRLGCGQCYLFFADLLNPLISDYQRMADHHVGKRPARAEVQQELSDLTLKLDTAIRNEAFEDAADLRDQIRLLSLADECLLPVMQPVAVGDEVGRGHTP